MHGRRKNYRAWDAQQCSQEPVAPRDALPEDDLVFFLLDLVPQIDLSPFHQYYAQELRGQPPFDVTMMVTLLVYAYSVGVCSSRRVAAACERNLAFRAVVGDDPPDFRTISDFRKIHLAAFRPLFLEVLRLAGEMGMVKLGNLSTDGTKMGANASRHKAMSYGYMNKEIQRLEAEIEQLLKQAEQLDAEQDAALGSRRGDELPDELKRREERLAKIREAKARLEAEARAKAEDEQRRRDEEQAKREAKGRKRRGKEPAPIDPTPEDNFRKACSTTEVTIVGGNGYRLPNESEWEYACRAGSATIYPFGDDKGELGEHAWYSGNADAKSHPVGRKRPNAWGFYDMLGNVWEWCADWYDGNYYRSSPPEDPQGPTRASQRVVRGGGWGDDPWVCRPGSRSSVSPGLRGSDLGFRVAAFLD